MAGKFLVLSGLVVLVSGMAVIKGFPGPEDSDAWEHRPDDPDYGKMWQLFSHVPVNQRRNVTDWDAEHGSGMHVDRAWQLHRGSPDTVIAVLDSGIRWHDADLLEKHYLNSAELPLPEGSKAHDANGDGKFSVSDYAGDSRVADTNANGKIDPGDLIASFSDGRDDDNNGFIDDISGWDFHEMDNDPHDTTDFGHGTGEARDSAAGLNNGIKYAGICGECRVVSVRLNDSFIVDAQSFAAGVRFAHVSRVDLIQQALGAVNHTEQVREAVNAAYDDGIVIIGSAADEHSYHHNFPSTIDPIVYTNAIRYDAMDFRDATTFVNFNNCSNFGARVDVATSGRSCSSEATGNLSGIAALTISYAKSLGRPLSPGSLVSLIKASADDVNLGPAEEESDRFSTYDGWDTMTGYGRTNAYQMLLAVKEGRVPPEARIRSPRWFALTKSDHEEVRIVYDAVSADEGLLNVTLSVARGVEAPSDAFKDVHQAVVSGEARQREIVLPALPQLELPANPRDHERNRYAYTFRLRVEQEGRPTAEARRTIFLLPDENARVFLLHGSGEAGGMFVDLNRDGCDEWVTANGEGKVAVTSASGTLPGFPVVAFDSRHGVGGAGTFAPLAAGDLDQDGLDEIVVLSLDGHIAALKANGEPMSGFPILIPRPAPAEADPDQVIAAGFMAAPVLVDLDQDGYLDIVAVSQDGLVHVYNHRGQPLRGFPFAAAVAGKKARLLSSPAVADLDKDGFPDLVFGSNHVGAEAGYLFAISARSKKPLHAGFPVRIPLIRDKLLPTVGTGIPTSPVIGDFDQDGEDEIFVHGFAGKAYFVSSEGRLKKSFDMGVGTGHGTNDDRMIPAFGHPSVARWNDTLVPVTTGVGRRMLVTLLLGGKRYEFQHMIAAWNPQTGTMFEHFPQPIDDMTLGMTGVAVDLDADGNDEVLASSGGYFLRGYHRLGRAPSWDRFHGGWAIRAPALGDFDGDGNWDIGLTTREGYSFIWPTRTKVGEATWPTFKGSNLRQGRF